MQNEQARHPAGKLDILSLLPEELDDFLSGMNQPRYRAVQIFRWLHRGICAFDDMTDLPTALRRQLAETCFLTVPEEVSRLRSADGTQKILWGLADSETVESVIMRYEAGQSICLSTQAGCRQGCAFCASAIGGLTRDLTAGEMLSQLLFCKEPVSRVVLMGIGEPLDNFDHTVRFLQLLSHAEGRNMSLRHVSLSTCGLVPQIDALSDLGFPVTLSVSLHAPDDETRRKIMPIARKYSVEQLIGAAKRFFEKTGRRVSYEYILLDGINDSPWQASLLEKLLRGQPAHINLIPCNPVEGKPYKPPSAEKTARFAAKLKRFDVTVRRTLGTDINAACGQLRRGCSVVPQRD